MDRAPAPAHLLLIAACAWLPACGLNQAGVSPPNDTIAYPASAIMDSQGDWLFVTNSNADLRYNDGTLTTFSLERARADRGGPPQATGLTAWPSCPQVDYSNPRSDDIQHNRCCWDALDNNVLNCDERWYVGADGDEGNGSGNVRIGSFAAGMTLQKVACPTNCPNCGATPTDDRLLLGVRGDTSLTFIDVQSVDASTPPLLKCINGSSGSVDFDTCDKDHRIVQATTALAAPMPGAEPPAVPLPDEPYALAIDPSNGLLYIGHLTGTTARAYSGGFSLFDIAPQGGGPLAPPRFVAPFPPPFPPNSVGSVGITALNTFTNSYGQTAVYASSRFVPQVSGLGTTATCPDNPVREIAAFPNGSTYASPLFGAETRGIQFIEGQDRAFVLQRTPPTLIGFVASTAAATDTLETCGSPTFLDQHKNSAGQVRLFVTCFADGEIYVFDPAVPTLIKQFSVGRGPSGLVFDDSMDPNSRHVAYVVGFGDNNVSVIDLTPGSRTEYHVVQRIGFPRTSPR